MKSRAAIGCFVLLILLVCGGGYAYWRFKTPPQVADKFSALPEEVKKHRREDAKKFTDNLEETRRKIKSGDKSPFHIQASEEVLNTLLQDRINTDKFPIHDLRVGLADEQLTMQGILPYKGAEVTATMTGKVAAENGKVVYTVDSLLLGGLLQAPDKWKHKAETEVSKGLTKLLESENVKISLAEVKDKQLILEGTPQ